MILRTNLLRKYLILLLNTPSLQVKYDNIYLYIYVTIF